MDWQTGFNALFGMVSAIVGWILHAMYDAVNDLRQRDNELHDRISRHIEAEPHIYMRRDDFSAFASRVESSLARIEAKFDQKADK